jgi:hypothetical protein
MAPNGRASSGDQCLLIGVKQTQCGHAATSESGLSRKEPRRALYFAQS